jgi:hypothetical protein
MRSTSDEEKNHWKLGFVKAAKEALERAMNLKKENSDSKTTGRVTSSQTTEPKTNWTKEVENMGLKYDMTTRTTESPKIKICTQLDSKVKWKGQVQKSGKF